MLANFLIGLREGLEATLIVSILIAYLAKNGHRDKLSQVYKGVAAAIGISLLAGAALTFGTYSLTFEAQEAVGGTLSIVAALMVTCMVLWMAKNSSTLAQDLHSKTERNLENGTALVWLAALSVGREGLETALFVWASAKASGEGYLPFFAALVGILVAVALGVALYKGLIRLNIAKFFKVSAVFLMIVAAGVLAYGIHDLQEAGILPGINTLMFDVSHAISLESPIGTVLKGVFNFSPATTWLEGSAWLLYISLVFPLYFFQTQHTKTKYSKKVKSL